MPSVVILAFYDFRAHTNTMNEADPRREALDLYEAAMPPAVAPMRRAAEAAWVAAGLTALIALAWAEPFSARAFVRAEAAGAPGPLIDWLAVPLVMALRALLLVESFGYVYHRFFQHVGFLTRQSAVFRRNQRFHWIHHMIIYPIGRLYRRELPYVQAEDGVAWSWVAPGVIAASLAFWSMGAGVGTFVFIAVIGLYAKYVVDVTHSRFHELEHPWKDSSYFHWLEDIHILHHWDQRKNFTIVHPLMDVLFGTYLSPASHRRKIQTALADEELTVSDLINWRYLLLEATPAEYAAFICEARRHPRSLRKVDRLLGVLRTRLEVFPGDARARDLEQRTSDLLRVVRPGHDAVPA